MEHVWPIARGQYIVSFWRGGERRGRGKITSKLWDSKNLFALDFQEAKGVRCSGPSELQCQLQIWAPSPLVSNENPRLCAYFIWGITPKVSTIYHQCFVLLCKDHKVLLKINVSFLITNQKLLSVCILTFQKTISFSEQRGSLTPLPPSFPREIRGSLEGQLEVVASLQTSKNQWQGMLFLERERSLLSRLLWRSSWSCVSSL